MKITIKSVVSTQVHTCVTFDTAREHVTEATAPDGTPVLSIGIESVQPVTRRRFITLMRRAVIEAKARKLKKLVFALDDLRALPGFELDDAEMLRLTAENMHMADYAYVKYKSEPKKGWDFLEEVVLLGNVSPTVKAALSLGELVATEVNHCRDLSNTPGGDMTPALLGASIKKSAAGSGVSVKVLGVKDLEKLKMGALLGVGRGAKEAPRFIVVEYQGGKKNMPPVVLVGKGITFDTGGLSLKPAQYMLDMHLDMSGGAAVAHAVIAAARMKLPVNAVALVPAAENSISGESFRPGDILTSMNGKTIDVLNTDAEGRLVLADALVYATRYNPTLVVDVATLTGASLVALGTKASAVMSKDDALAARICALGEESGDYCWPLPLWDEYKDMVKGRFGDVSNIDPKYTREAGTIEGGMFLAEFAEGPWVHIDMAPRMVSDKSDCLAEGAAGAPVRLLVRLLESYAHKM